jgi:hypothetical protein
MTPAVKNLYSLFDDLASSGISHIRDSGEYKVIATPDSPWPNFVFDIKAENLKHVTGDIKDFLLPQDCLNISSVELTKDGFFLVDSWEGMQYNGAPASEENCEQLTVELVKTYSDAVEWANIASEVLFKNKKLPDGLIQYIHGSVNYEMYWGNYHGRPVCTAMTFIDEDTIGIYMVATVESMQKKGFAFRVLSEILQRHSSDSKMIILQSTKAGIKLYRKLHFETKNKIFIIKKI